MATFGQWLLAQEDQAVAGTGEPTTTARLAKAWKADPERGNTSSPSGMKRHIASRWGGEPVDGRPDQETAIAWLAQAQDEYRGQRHLQPAGTAQSAASDSDLRDLVKQLAFDVGWIRAALSMLLTDEQLEVLAVAAAETGADPEDAETLDWAGMWAKADHSGAGEAG